MECNKTCYDSKKTARTAANYVRKSGRKRTRVIREYYCDKCGCWHLTHHTYFGDKRIFHKKKKRRKKYRH